MKNQHNSPSFYSLRWSSLTQMETPREKFALVCLHSSGDLVAIGGHYNGKYVGVAEALMGGNAHTWHPLLTPLAMRSAVLFRQGAFVTGRKTTDFSLTSDMFTLHPPTLGGRGQWLRL